MVFKKVGETQKGGLYFHDSSYGEIGFVVVVKNKVIDTIWFDNKQEAIKALTKMLEEVQKYEPDTETP